MDDGSDAQVVQVPLQEPQRGEGSGLGHFPEGAGQLGKELPVLLFRLKGLVLDLGKDKEDQEWVTKFVTSLDRQLAEQTSS